MLDVFAWIVLLILLAIALAIFFIAGSLPGPSRKAAAIPGCRPYRRRLGDVDLWLCPMASHNYLGLCRFPGPS